MATNIVLKRSSTSGATPSTSDLELGELALNTYDGKMYMKKTVSGSSSIVELTGTKALSSSEFDYIEYKYVATSNQTSFSGNDSNGVSLTYTAGTIMVFLNGVLLDPTDYTATNTTSVVLDSAASTGDILIIHQFNQTGLTEVHADTTPQLAGDLDVNGNDIVSTSNGNIDIIPHGTGDVNLGTDTVKVGGSGEDVTLTTNGTGDITINTNSGTNSGSIVIADGANNDITITPNGTGDVIIDGLKYPQSDGSNGQVLKTNGSGQLSFGDDAAGTITAVANGADNRIATFSSSTALNGEANLTFDGSTLAASGAPFTISNTNNGNNIDIKTTSSNSLVHAVKIHSGGVFEAKQGAVFNEDSNDVDFRVESNGETHAIFVDAGNDEIGLFTDAPNGLLHIGDSNAEGDATNPALQIGGTSNYRLGIYTDAETAIFENKNGDDGFEFKVKTAGESFRINGGTGQIQATPLGVANPSYSFIGDTNTGMTRPTGDTIQFVCNGSQAMRVTESLVTIDGGKISMSDAAGNVSVGYEALNVIGANSGDSCTAMGYQALEKVTDGIHNTGMGYRTGFSITTGGYNVLMGNFAGDAITSANSNTCIGYQAGSAIDVGPGNTCVGYQAGDALNGSNGKWNVAVGLGALGSATAVFQNTAVGQGALGSNNAHGNTAVGSKCLEDNTSGSGNNGFGYFCLNEVTTGDDNNCFGTGAGRYITGSSNTAMGSGAGGATTSGSNNTLLGHDAGISGSPGGAITTGSNEIVLGDEDVSKANIQVSFTVASDERDKTEFTDLDIGLDFVKSLKPYTFRWDKRSKYVDWENNPDTDLLTITNDGTHKEAQLDIGFKAQDVEALEKAAGYDKDNKTNLTVDLSGDGKQYSMKYEKLVPVLTKAIQEQQTIIEDLKSRIETLEG